MDTRFPAATVVGSTNLEIIVSTDGLPAAGETIGGGVLHQQPGRKGANYAVAAARLGGSARMIGAVGDDAEGRLMLEALLSADWTPQMRVLDGDATGTPLIMVDGGGENQIVVCPGANSGFHGRTLSLGRTRRCF
jgi:ribokinase